MKRSSTPCSRLRPRPRPRRASRFARLAGALALALATPGCVVLQSTHERVVGELEEETGRLSTELEKAQASNEALSKERVQLLDEMEDLRVARDELESDIAQLTRTRDLLSAHLAKREQEVAELSKLSGQYEALVTDLESEVASGQIQITQLREGLRLNLSQDILFRSGAVTLEPYGVGVLERVAGQLVELGHNVEVQGHSDDVPLSAGLAQRWGTNWELAAARAAQVVRLFERRGVDPGRLRAVSFGPHAPIADNDSAEGRAQNRRIEIRLIPVDGAEAAASEEVEESP